MRWMVSAALLMLWLGVSTQAGTDGGLVVAAARSGDLMALRAAVRQSPDVNVPDVDGTTALHWAVHHADVAAIDLLLRAGAKVATPNRYGATPLWVAARTGRAAVLKRLLDAGADPNTRMAEGDTVLMNAARAGSADGVHVLLAHGADPNATESSKGQSALMWAAAENHASVMTALIEAGARIGERSKPGTLVNPQEGGFTALQFAARSNAADAVRLLLRAGASVNERSADGSTSLVLAVASGHFDLASELLDTGADPNAGDLGWTALHEIAWIRRPQIGLNHPSPVPHGMTGSLALVTKLIAHGAHVNARVTREPDRRYVGRSPGKYVGATPFFLAAKTVDVPLMKLLVASGADPNLPNVDETTPLMAAAGVGIHGIGDNPGTDDEITEAVGYCLQLGADPRAVDLNDDTPMHGVALRGSDRALALLASAGARLNIRNKPRGPDGQEGGFTPWRIAAGVYISGVARQQLRTADLLRRLLEQQGLPVE